MDESNKEDNQYIKNQTENNIDLRDIFFVFYRNRILIIKLTLFSILLGGFSSLTIKRIWEGEFQIVLDKENRPMNGLVSNTASLGILKGQTDALKTQVGILKSPLVLSEVFEFVKKEKSLDFDTQKNSSLYRKWKNKSLTIELEKGTSILNLSYRDNDKKLILPVLNKISDSYQKYSGRKRSREIELSKAFFEEQIKKYKTKSIDSLRNAQKYATEQDISILSGEADIDQEIPNSINIEAIRVNSSNEIKNINTQLEQLERVNDEESIMYIGRSIDELVAQGLPQRLDDIDREILLINSQLKQLENFENDSDSILLLSRSIPALVSSGLPERLNQIDDKIITLRTLKEEIKNFNSDPEKIQYFGDSIPQLINTGLPDQLRNIETELAFKQLTFKENDKSILNLKKRREILIKIFTQQAIGYLEADIIMTQKSRPMIIEKLKNRAIGLLNSRKFNLQESKPRLITILKKKAKSFLEAKRSVTEAKLKAAERPEGVLIRYKQLIRESLKDKETLASLEKEYRALLLREARVTDPWELITTPTVLNYPVAPNKKKIVFLSFLIGLFGSSTISYLLEKKKNLIFSINQINLISNFPSIFESSILDLGSFRKKFDMYLEIISSNNKNDILIVSPDNIINSKISQVKKLSKIISEKNLEIIHNIDQIDKSKKVILLLFLGKTSRKTFKEYQDKLNAKKITVFGTIVLDNLYLLLEKKDWIVESILFSKVSLKKVKTIFNFYSGKYTKTYFMEKYKYYLKVFNQNFGSKNK